MPTFQNTVPVQDIEQSVRQMVTQMAGRRLPSERDLSACLHISRPRLRAILAGLRAEGLIEQRPGSGTYAILPNGRPLRRIALLIDDSLKLGDDPFFSQSFGMSASRAPSRGRAARSSA